MAGGPFQSVGFGNNGTVTSTTNLGMPPFQRAVISLWLTLGTTGWTWRGLAGGVLAGIEADFVTNTIVIQAYRAGGLAIFTHTFSVSLTTGLHHLLVSIDTAAGRCQLYVDDALIGDITGLGTGTMAVPSSIAIAATGTHAADCSGDFWFSDVASFFDLSVTANRRKFISSGLLPEDLGADGSVPFSAVPRVYLHAPPGGTVANFIANAGSGGAFTQSNVTLGACGVIGATVTAPDYAVSLNEDTSLSSAVVATVTGGVATYTVVSGVAHGVLTLNADGTYVYDAARGYFGSDSFTYRATIGGISDDGVVSITVNQAFPLSGVLKVLLPPAVLQFCDADGNPYAGGTLEMYEPGTTNPKDTWGSATGDTDTLNANPIVLDAAGRAIIYGDGAYRTVLRDSAGNLVWDQPSFTYVSACMVPVVGAADLATARDAMGITEAIEAEAEARAAADSAEASTRASADATLQSNINAETSRAEAAEAALGARIDGLPAPAPPGNVQGTGGTLDASGHAHVTFGTPFATDGISVVVTGQAIGVQSGAFNVANLDRFGFDVWGSVFGSRTPAAGIEFYWMAIGD